MSAPEITLLCLCEELNAAVEACDHIAMDPTRRIDSAAIMAQATVSMLQDTPAILADVWPTTAVSGVRKRILLIQRHLLRMVISEESIDPARACRILQHLYADSALEWAPRVKQLAADLQGELPASPRDMRLLHLV